LAFGWDPAPDDTARCAPQTPYLEFRGPNFKEKGEMRERSKGKQREKNKQRRKRK